MSSFRLILSGYSDAAFNMAADEALFDIACRDNNRINEKDGCARPEMTLRLYGWQPAAISLGCFQSAEGLRLDRIRKAGVDLIRRPTGGGLILHDTEITYSVIASKEALKAGSIKESYYIICSFLQAAFCELGLEAEAAGRKPLIAADEGSYVCFSAVGSSDISIQDRKIGGNAQRRRKNMVLQHGSIPFCFDKERLSLFLKDTSFNSNNCSSLNALLKKELTFSDMEHILIDSFSRTFNKEPAVSSFSEDELALIDRLKKNKYLRDEWNLYKKAPAGKKTACLA